VTDATRHGGDRRDAAGTTTDEIGPDRELLRLRAENLALKGELIGLKLAVGRGTARRSGDTGSGLRDLAAELRAAAAALEEAGLDLRRTALHAERLAEAVRERDGRLAEMSHRVKNDLHLVTSLLRVEAERQRNPAARAALGRAGARVEAVARVHELLCDGDGSGTVAVDRYLRETCAGLAELLGVDGRHRALVVRAEAAVLPADTARSLGLVVNELVTNAFRHAFAADGPGTVWVEVGRDAGGRLRLGVADDGAGLPEGVDADGGLGLRLVTMTAAQLGAVLDIGRDGGTQVTLTLPASPADGAGDAG
jgi:two-component sensor histidine kinase